MLTAGGFVCIESIKEGDEVYSYDADTGEIGLKKVQETYVYEVTELVHLTIDDETIDTTREHPFFLEGLGFIAASELRAGDEIRLYDGSTGAVKSVEIETLENPVNVYNFEVEDWHTYYVGEEGALVHNKCGEDFGNYKFKEGVDADLRGEGTYKDALDMAFEKTGISKENYTVTKWGKDKYGKSFPVEWRSKSGAEVNIDLGHSPSGNAPSIPHVGWQTSGKRGNGGGVRGHIFIDEVPYNR